MKPQITFINQAEGHISRELVTTVADRLGDVRYYSPDRRAAANPRIELVAMPRYRKTSRITRMLSWCSFWIRAFPRVLCERSKGPLFIVTNPPIAPFIGYVVKKLRGRPYAILFYDMYPEALIKLAGVSKKSLIVKLWRMANRLAVRHADRVITISPNMAKVLHQYYPEGAEHESLSIVPTWVDTNHVRPIPKQENPFAEAHGQRDKFTVLYAGNIGAAHDLSLIPDIAFRLRDQEDIHFMIIGDGLNKRRLEDQCARLGLNNVTFLPLQPQEKVPQVFATGEVAVIALGEEANGISMPSKTYYAMAAGSALLGVSSAESDLAAVISKHRCGVNIVPGDVDGGVAAVLELCSQFEAYRARARKAAELFYGKEVCVAQMVELIREMSKHSEAPEWNRLSALEHM